MNNRQKSHALAPAFALIVVCVAARAHAQQEEEIDTSALEELVPEEEAGEEEALPAGEFEDVEEDVEIEETAEDEEAGKDLGPTLQEGQWLEYPSTLGYSGLVKTMAATSGSPMSWSVGLNMSFFVKEGFLYEDEVEDDHRRIQGAVHFRFTPIEYLELFLAIDSYANATDLSIQRPQLFQTLGDTTIGVKGLYTVDFYTVALALYPRFLNKVGNVGFEWKATSVTLMLANTFDLEPRTNFPLRIHLDLGWDFDNSAKLVEKREKSMTGEFCDRSPETCYQQYIMRFERFALDVNRNDAFLMALAFDFTTPWVNPFLEWTMEIPVNRQGFDCLQQQYTAFPEDDSCLDIEGGAAFPMDLTIGFRFQPPPVPGLSFLAAADIGLLGVKNHVRELPANPPYNIYFGVSYSHVKKKELVEVEKEVVKEVVKEVAPPPRPHILGKITDSETGAGIEGAVVTIQDEDGFALAELNPLVTKPDGTFVSYPLDPGTYTLGVEAEWYFDPIDCSVTLESQDEELVCELRPMPKLSTLKGKVSDAQDGSPITGATVKIEGPESKSVTTDSLGLFELEMEGGDYTAMVNVEDYFAKQATFTAPAGESVEVDIQISKKPKKNLVVVKKKKIHIRRQIQFEFDSATIKPKSYVVLDSVVDVMLTHPEIELVEVQGHTDDRGDAKYNLDLSQRRADAVRQYLIDAGIDPDRLIAKGYGETKPIAPNVTAKGRARNRRVEFHILSQEGD
jgi:outer membrane protein OmpA-like peptidoglycan-associated protein